MWNWCDTDNWLVHWEFYSYHRWWNKPLIHITDYHRWRNKPLFHITDYHWWWNGTVFKSSNLYCGWRTSFFKFPTSHKRWIKSVGQLCDWIFFSVQCQQVSYKSINWSLSLLITETVDKLDHILITIKFEIGGVIPMHCSGWCRKIFKCCIYILRHPHMLTE